jgi:S-formylglutathione hydrolase FrmB
MPEKRAKRRTAIRRRRFAAAAAIMLVAVAVWAVVRGSGDGVGDANPRGALVSHLTIDSEAVGEQLPVTLVRPPGGEGGNRPLLVFLHGRGANEDSFLDDEMFAALANLGRRAPIVAFPYGGDHSYWHDRDDGDWGSYVTDEVIPAVVDRSDADPNRVAIGGISMGGFGAYDLAVLNPGRFCAVGGHSPALWEDASATAPGAFDDAEDFARNDVVGAAQADPASLASQPIWLDAGDEDPFRPGDDAFAQALQAAGAPLTSKTWPGGHDDEYWNAHWDQYLRFYADACKG